MAPTAARSRLKQEIQKSFKLNGYQLRLDGCKYLEDLLSELDDPREWGQWIEKILEVLQRKELESSVLTKSVLEKAVQVNVSFRPFPRFSFVCVIGCVMASPPLSLGPLWLELVGATPGGADVVVVA